MSQRSYNHLALATSRSKSRTGSNESTPQTLCTNSTDERISLSAKDIFDAGDTQKYRAISQCLPDTQELIFVLMKPNQKVSKSTKLTMAEWCDKHEILWYNIDTLKELVDYVSDTRRN